MTHGFLLDAKALVVPKNSGEASGGAAGARAPPTAGATMGASQAP
jgi:hypothetical protein